MWLLLAFTSALFLGFYDVFKKKSVNTNAVIPVLILSTLFSSIIFSPFIIASLISPEAMSAYAPIYVPIAGWDVHKYIVLKSAIVLVSWIFGYFGMKHLPITIVGPINATRPIMVLVGAMLIFGERLNIYQWTGVIFGIVSFFLLSISGKKEGINFRNNKWIIFVILSAITGAVSGLYDKFLMARFELMLVQSWYNIYQCAIMFVVMMLLWYPVRDKNPFTWRWSILLISVALSIADFAYFYALTFDDSMISVVSMVRRSSVVVSFIFGAILFREKNLRRKAFDLLLVIIGMLFLYWGSK